MCSTAPSFTAQSATWLAWALLTCILLLPSSPVLAESDTADATITQLRTLRGPGSTQVDAHAKLRSIEARITRGAPYSMQRELMRTQLAMLQKAMGVDKTLKICSRYVRSLQPVAIRTQST